MDTGEWLETNDVTELPSWELAQLDYIPDPTDDDNNITAVSIVRRKCERAKGCSHIHLCR